MPQQFVQVLNLTQFTGNNVNELPIDTYLNAYGEGTGEATVEDGVLTLSWPGITNAFPIQIQTGDWLDPAGVIYAGDVIASSYVPYTQVENPT